MVQHSAIDHSAVTGAGIQATLVDAKGDILAASAADTVARLAVGANNTILMAASGQATGLKWGYGLEFHRRLLGATFATPADGTHNVNSTTYIGSSATIFYHDWDAFPATHFIITGYGFANEASQTISLQLTTSAAPTNPISSAGNDVVVVHNGAASTSFSSGWIAVSDAMSGLTSMCIALKGSTATVDLTGRWLDVGFRIA